MSKFVCSEVADPQKLQETTKTKFEFDVLISDNFADDPGEIIQTVIVHVIQPNRPPEVADSPPRLYVVEQSLPGTRVFTEDDLEGTNITSITDPAFVSDPDGDEIFVSLAECRDNEFFCKAFALNDTGELTVRDNTYLDYSTTDPVIRLIRVEYTDHIIDEPVEAVLLVEVEQLRDAPEIETESGECDFDEGVTGTVCSLKAYDRFKRGKDQAFRFVLHGTRNNHGEEEDRIDVDEDGNVTVRSHSDFRSIVCEDSPCRNCSTVDEWVEVDVSAILVKRTDSLPGPVESSVTTISVHVNVVNEQPRFYPFEDKLTVKELQDDVEVGDISKMFCDREGQELLYGLVSDNPFSAHFSVEDGILRVRRGEPFNYEMVQQGTITIEVEERQKVAGELLSREESFTVYIVDVPEPPIVDTEHLHVDELTTHEDGPFGRINVSDPDIFSGTDKPFSSEPSSFEFHQLSHENEFEISPDGKVSIAEGYVPDYEPLYLEDDHIKELRFLVNDTVNDVSTTASVLIEIVDIPEPPYFTPLRQNFTVNIHAEEGDIIGEVQADTPDFDDSIYFELLDGPGFIFMSRRGLISFSGNSSVNMTTDAVGERYTFTVRVVDSTDLTVIGKHYIEIINQPEQPEWSGASLALKQGDVMFKRIDEHHRGVFGEFQLECHDPNEKGVQFQILQASPSIFDDIFRIDREAGKLVVTDGQSSNLDYETLYRRGQLNGTFTVACVDTFGLRTEGTIILEVQDIPEPPEFINLPSDKLMETEEFSAIGKLLEQVEAHDVDFGSRYNLEFSVRRYYTADSFTLPVAADDATYFEEGHLGMSNLTVDKGLNFFDQSHYELLIVVEDETGLNDTVKYELEVLFVNEPPVFDESEFLISVFENVSSSDVLADDSDFPFYDRNPNTNHEFNVRWSDPDNLLRIRGRHRLHLDHGCLNYETRPYHKFIVRVTDGEGEFDESNVTLEVLNVNDLVVSNAIYEPHDPSGGSTVTFRGEDLGPIWKEVEIFAVGTAPGGNMQIRSNCSRHFDGDEWENSEVNCSVPAGVGKNIEWRLTAGEDSTRVSIHTRYRKPIITAVYWPDDADTTGNSEFVLEGEDFGPTHIRQSNGSAMASPVEVFYRVVSDDSVGTLSASDCSLEAPSRIVCRTVEGSGTNLQFRVVTGASHAEWKLESKWFSPDDDMGYALPRVHSILPLKGSFPTGGVSEAFYIVGSNFGPSVASREVKMKNDWLEFDVSCNRKNHSALLCDLPQGVGIDYSIQISVSGQHSNFSADVISYDPPSLDRVTDTGGETPRDFDTEGGEVVYLEGINFGLQLYAAGSISVYYGKHLQYQAANCDVDSSHRQLQCLTVPGVGKNHSWQVFVGNQSSNTLEQVSNYHPPVVSTYSRPNSTMIGVSNLETPGGEIVHIRGRHFGPPGTTVQLATYGSGNETFKSPGCDVLDHNNLQCKTAPGAGSDQFWTVVIGDQESSVATTSYAPPVILDFKGLNDTDPNRLRTLGGEPILIFGENFGPPSKSHMFLSFVRYGRTGREYTGQECEVISHGKILCLTEEGHGQRHRWTVEIAGQQSRLSEKVTSYAPPVIHSLNPQNGSTQGVVVTLRGEHFGQNLLDRVPVSLLIDSEGYLIRLQEEGRWSDDGLSVLDSLLTLQQEDPSAFLERVDQFDISPSTVEEYLSNIHEVSVNGFEEMSILDDVTEQYKIRLPSGFGKARPLFLKVGDTMSRLVIFDYDPPEIDVVSPRQLTGGRMRLTVYGRNFCGGSSCGDSSCCGRLYVEEELKDVSGECRDDNNECYSHDKAIVVVKMSSLRDSGNSPFRRGNVEIEVLDLPDESTSFEFENPPAQVLAQIDYCSSGRPRTEGGERFELTEVQSISNDVSPEEITVTVGGKLCTNLTIDDTDFLEDSQVPVGDISCDFPPHTGTDREVQIEIAGLNSVPSENVKVCYAEPQVCEVIIEGPNIAENILYQDSAGDCQNMITPGVETDGTIFTQGGEIRVRGFNFGSSDFNVSPQTKIQHQWDQYVSILSQDHHELVLEIPPGAGNDHQVEFILGEFSTEFELSYAKPQIKSIRSTFSGGPGRMLDDFVVIPTLPTDEDRLYIYGENFGPPEFTNIQVWLLGAGVKGDKDNGESECTVVSSNHTMVVCIPPEGQGDHVKVKIQVEGQEDETIDGWVRYAKPEVGGIVPSNGPTDGKTKDGHPVGVTIHGTNLGFEGQVVFKPEGEEWDTAADDPIFNHTSVKFPLPEGFGSNVEVKVIVNYGEDYIAFTQFSYDPPQVDAVYRLSDDLLSHEDCDPVEQCITFQGTTSCFKSFPDCFPTTGSVPVEITGSNFGPVIDRQEARIRGKLCSRELLKDEFPEVPNQFSNHHSHLCMLPEGMGANVAVTVTVGNEGRRSNKSFVHSYDPPRVDNIMPNQPDAQGQEIRIRGTNFGPSGGDVTVILGNVTCQNSVVDNEESISCTTQTDTVGPKRVELHVAERSVEFPMGLELVVTECKPGSYGLEGELCVDCESEERGAVCPGGERLVDLVYSDEGFWRTNDSAPSDRCHDLRQERDECPVFLPCEPPWACAGDNECSEEYTGYRCQECAEGFFRINGECQECPDHAWLLGVLLALAAIGACLGAYVINSKGIRLAAFTIGIDYFQVLAMFARTRVRWPSSMETLLQAMSFFNLNLELAAPECYVTPPPPYEVRWLATMALPLLALGLLGVVYVAHYLYKLLVLKRPAERRHTHVNALVATIVTIMYILYIFLTRMTLDVFNCMPTDPPDGNRYMAGMTEIECFEADVHVNLLFPLGLVTLVVYVLAFPVGSYILLRRNKEGVKYDQILRAHDKGNSRFSNPYYHFRRRYQRLYNLFRPGKWYWVLMILLRKFLIAFTSLMFNTSPTYQLSMALLVMFASFSLHVRHQPYMSRGDMEEVVEEHKRKVKEGDSLHIRIQATMDDMEKKNVQTHSAAAGWQSQSIKMKQQQSKKLVSEPVIRFITNFNTVESILLGSAILVNLAGIMFLSSRFEGESMELNRGEFETLGVMCVILVSISVVYFTLVFIYELMYAFRPETAFRCISFFSCGRTVEVNESQGVKQKRPSVFDRDPQLQTHSNPLIAQLAKRTEGKRIHSDSGEHGEGNEELKAQLDRAKQEIKELKRANELKSTGVGMEGRSTRAMLKAKRTNFGQHKVGEN